MYPLELHFIVLYSLVKNSSLCQGTRCYTTTQLAVTSMMLQVTLSLPDHNTVTFACNQGHIHDLVINMRHTEDNT